MHEETYGAMTAMTLRQSRDGSDRAALSAGSSGAGEGGLRSLVWQAVRPTTSVANQLAKVPFGAERGC